VPTYIKTSVPQNLYEQHHSHRLSLHTVQHFMMPLL